MDHLDHLDHLDSASNGAAFPGPCINGSLGPHGPALLAEASAAGISLRVAGDIVKAEPSPPAEFLARLRVHKLELAELLQGDRCRYCGERLVWSRPGAVAFSDGTAGHLLCYERGYGVRHGDMTATP